MRRVCAVLLVAGCGGGGQPDNEIQSSLSVDRFTALAGVDSVAVTVIVQDRHGPVAGQHVDLFATGSENVLDPPGGETDANGQFAATWSSVKAESKGISENLDPSTVHEVEFVAGFPARLDFLVQPSGGEAGQVLGEIHVGVFDAFGNPAPQADSYPITLTSSVPVNGQTTVIPNADSVAVFQGLRVNSPGTYHMTASAPGLPDATSAAFNVVAGDARLGGLVASPTRVDADGIATTQITLTAQNAAGLPIPGLQVHLTATGTGNTFGASSGATDENGVFTTTLASTVAEHKVIVADLWTVIFNADVLFTGFPCTPVFPTRPFVPVRAAKLLAAGDFNEDGVTDALTLTDFGGGMVVVTPGRSNGSLSAPLTSPLPGITNAIAVGDFDRDGHLDVAAVQQQSAVVIARGLGDGHFGAPTSIALSHTADLVVAGDFNRDGKLDLAIVMTRANAIDVLLGNGDGTFATPLEIVNGNSPELLLVADVNSDGKLDIVTADQVDVWSYLGNGDGTFAAGISTFMNAGRAVAIGDFDGDGAPDLISRDLGIAFWKGNRNGTFTHTKSTSGREGGCAVPVDVDGDGKLDVLLCGDDLQIAHGLGDGTFTFTPYPVAASSIAMAGTNLYIAAPVGVGVVPTVGGQPLAPSYSYIPSGGSTVTIISPEFAFDMSNLLDLAVYDSLRGVQVLLGQTDGSWTPGPFVPASQPECSTVGELNGDFHGDLITSDHDRLYTYLGNGAGSLATPQSMQVPQFTGLAFVNLGLGGTRSLIASTPGSDLLVYHGNGDGTFAAPTSYPAARWQGPALIVDVDHDGWDDVVVPSLLDKAVVVLKNNANGALMPPVSYPLPIGATVVVARDFDGDNNLDLAVLGPTPNSLLSSIATLRGHEDGTFEPAVVTDLPLALSDLGAADVDFDGTWDLVAGSPTVLVVLQGYGDGSFRAPLAYDVGGGGLVLSDRNGDGRVDVIRSSRVGIVSAYQGVCIPAGN